jgi:hypothetical protein
VDLTNSNALIWNITDLQPDNQTRKFIKSFVQKREFRESALVALVGRQDFVGSIIAFRHPTSQMIILDISAVVLPVRRQASSQFVQFIERIASANFANGVESATRTNIPWKLRFTVTVVKKKNARGGLSSECRSFRHSQKEMRHVTRSTFALTVIRT